MLYNFTQQQENASCETPEERAPSYCLIQCNHILAIMTLDVVVLKTFVGTLDIRSELTAIQRCNPDERDACTFYCWIGLQNLHHGKSPDKWSKGNSYRRETSHCQFAKRCLAWIVPFEAQLRLPLCLQLLPFQDPSLVSWNRFVGAKSTIPKLQQVVSA